MKQLRREVLLIGLLLLLSAAAIGQGRYRAVVVGVAGFGHGYASLDYTARDARKVGAALEDLGYIVKILAADVDAGQVKCEDVTAQLAQAASKSQPGDTLLFFFAGHGSRQDGKDYFLFSDSDPANLTKTALSLDTVSAILNDCKATQRVFVIDVCRNSGRADGKTGFRSGRLDKGFKDRMDQVIRESGKPGILSSVLYACSPEEVSKESEEERASIFASRFILALNSPGAGPLTAGNCLDYISARLPADLKQRPVMSGAEDLGIVPPERRLRLPVVDPPIVETTTPAGNGQPLARRNEIDKADMIFIEGGDSPMGDDDQPDNPRHTVTLTGFWIYKSPVTVRQYRQFCVETGRMMPPPPTFNGDWANKNQPIVNVTWDDAKAYCEWAGGHLPYEAQWEKAARGIEGRKYPWGELFDADKLWSSKRSNGDAGGPTTAGQDRFNNSPYGVCDMDGNVWQWCQDYYDANIWSTTFARQSDPVNEGIGPKQGRVLRGGSWYNYDPVVFRASYRYRAAPNKVSFAYGFRCVIPGP